MSAESSQDEVVHVCQPCGKEFEDKAGLVNHMLEEHTATKEKERKPPPRAKKRKLKADVAESTKCTLEADVAGTTKPKLEPYVADSTEGSVAGVESLEVQQSTKFVCKICDHAMETLGECRMHSLEHADGHTCKICERMFTGQMRLQNHILGHMKAQTFVCILCEKTFSFDYDLRKHAWVSHAKSRCCGICGGKFKDQEAFRSHFDGDHQTVQMIRLSSRGRTAPSVERRKSLAQGKKPPSPKAKKAKTEPIEETLEPEEKKSGKFSCVKCDSLFASEEQRDAHWKQNHLTVRKYKCECNVLFEKKALLERHMRRDGHASFVEIDDTTKRRWRDWVKTAKSTEVKGTGGIIIPRSVHKFFCKCGLGYTSLNSLRRHAEEFHLKIKNYRCECGEEFYQKDQADVHQLVAGHEELELEKLKNESDTKEEEEDDTDPTNFICDVCGELFMNPTSLHKHRATHEEAEKRGSPCPNCPEVMTSAYLLKEHIRLAHSQIKCDLCSEQMRSMEDYKEHNRTVHKDLGDPRYPCQICGRQFNSAQAVYSHSAKHNGSVFQCTRCEKSFNLRSQLNRHFNDVHLKIKEFHCQECDKKFARRHHLESHLLRHANKRAFCCTFCGEDCVSNDLLTSHLEKEHGIFKRQTVKVVRLAGEKPTDQPRVEVQVQVRPMPSQSEGPAVASDAPTADISLVRASDGDQPIVEYNLENADLVYQCGDCEECFTDVEILRLHSAAEHENSSSLTIFE